MPDTQEIQLDEIEFLSLGEEPQQETTVITDDKDDNKDTVETNKDNKEDALDLEPDESKKEQEENIEQKEDKDKEQKSLYAGILESSELDLTDDEKQELLSIDEDETGFTTFTEKIADKKATARFQKIMEKYPMAADLVKYEENGGNPEEYFEAYFPSVDYNEVKIEENDSDIQKDVIAESLRQQGFGDEEIKETISDYENGGILHKQSQRSLKLLQNNQQSKIEEFKEKQKTLDQQSKQQVEKEKQEVNKIVDNGEIKGIKIPDAKKKDFQQYLFKPVTEDGLSQALVDSKNMDMENRLLIAYLQMSGFDLSKLIQSESKNKTVKSLRDSLKGGDSLKNKQDAKQTSQYSKTQNFSKIETPFD